MATSFRRTVREDDCIIDAHAEVQPDGGECLLDLAEFDRKIPVSLLRCARTCCVVTDRDARPAFAARADRGQE